MIQHINSSTNEQKQTKTNSNYHIMKKHLILSFVFILGIGIAKAQPESAKDSAQTEMNQAAESDELARLSSMSLSKVIGEAIKMAAKIQAEQKKSLALIDAQEKAGEITAEQAEEKREDVNDRAEESMDQMEGLMEAWGESYGKKWEAWGEEFEANMEANENGEPLVIPEIPGEGMDNSAPSDSTKKKRNQKIIISEDGITIKDGEEGDRPFALEFDPKDDDEDDDEENKTDKIERTVGYSDINFGFNQLLEGGQYQIIDEPAEQQFWKSTTFELGGGWKTRLGSPYSKFYLKYGGEFSWHNFRLKGNNVISKQSGVNSGALFAADSNSISKSRFEIVYFNIPVMLQLDLSKLGDVDESFTMGIGGYGGIRLTSRRRLEYNDFEGSSVESEIKNDFYSNPFRYGAMAQIGWGSFKVTAKYDLSTMFEANKDFNKNYQMASIAFGWSL